MPGQTNTKFRREKNLICRISILISLSEKKWKLSIYIKCSEGLGYNIALSTPLNGSVGLTGHISGSTSPLGIARNLVVDDDYAGRHHVAHA
jgi:hypothetical protein